MLSETAMPVSSPRKEGLALKEALAQACKVRLRPILMTTLATILGLIPMALALEPGSEQYAPLARAILGGLTVSGMVTVFLVPSALPAHAPQGGDLACGNIFWFGAVRARRLCRAGPPC